MRVREKANKKGQSAISAKVSKMIRSGEHPNTPAGRKAALGKAYGMLKEGRLGPRGGYKKATKQQ